MIIYIARRSFRNKGIRYLPGDIIKSPEDIKLLKCKISEGVIMAFDRQHPSTVDNLKVIGLKVDRPVLQEVKEYLAELDAIEAAGEDNVEDNVEDNTEEE